MTSDSCSSSVFRVAVPDPLLRLALISYKNLPPFDHMDIQSDFENPDFVIDDIPAGLRLGHVLDFLALHLTRHHQNMPDILPVSGGILKNQARTIITTSGITIPLTFKERGVILALYQAKNHLLSRSELLADLWGYVPDVETHTLETHIYRLRQKIESDPAKPQTLITTEKGYQFCPA